jgi:predicted deacylase
MKQFVISLGLVAWLGSQLAATTCAAAGLATNSLLADTRFATFSYLNESGQPGQVVFIVGGVHGNEPAGALAADRIRHWPLLKGKLVVIPRANVPTLEARRRLTPGVATNLSNLNRNYPKAGETNGARGELAQAIWELARQHRPDWVLDLHEGFDFNQKNQRSVGSSIIAFSTPASLTAADLMLAAVNEPITNAESKFVRKTLPVDGSLARAAGEHLGVPGLTLETTTKEPLEKRVQQHEIMIHALLRHLGMIELPLDALTPKTTRVALYRGPGTGGGGPTNLLWRLNRPLEGLAIQEVTPEQIQTGVLTNFDVVIFAGGSASKQAAALAESGREQVRNFVGNGGGYVGICAGAYLATSGFSWGLKIIDARTVSPKWQRGIGTIKMELSDPGREILGERTEPFNVLYANGPIVQPAKEAALVDYESLAFFRTELARNGTPVGVMVDSPAIFAGPFLQGRVVCISPHPEQTTGLDDFVPKAIQWLLAKKFAAP